MTGETTPWAGEARRGGCSPCSERAQHSEACLLLCESVCAMYVVYWCIPLRCELALSLTLSLSLSLCSCCRLTSYFVTHHDPRAVAAYAFSYGPDDGSVARRRVHTPLAYIAADTHRHIHIDTHRERERERERHRHRHVHRHVHRHIHRHIHRHAGRPPDNRVTERRVLWSLMLVAVSGLSSHSASVLDFTLCLLFYVGSERTCGVRGHSRYARG